MASQVFPIFVGSGRSGTTVFRNIFDGHPDLAMTHEAHFIAPMAQRRKVYESGGFDRDHFVADLYTNSNFVRQGLDRNTVAARLEAGNVRTFADAVRAVFALYAAERGKTLYGDKTPGYVNHLELLGAVFPEAKFVHIIRDGRDVALGYLDRDEWGPSTIGEAAMYWRSRVARGREAGRALGSDRYVEVRYEDLVDDPDKTIRLVCDFLGLEFHDEMLRFHERGQEFISVSNTPDAFGGLAKPITKGMRNWRTQMAPGDVELFEAIAGDLLDALGYDRGTTVASVASRAKAAAANLGWQAKRLQARAQPLARRLMQRVRSMRR